MADFREWLNMSGALQAVFQNQRSFRLSIGDAYEGGFFAGQISTAGNSIADYNLVIGPVASAQNSYQAEVRYLALPHLPQKVLYVN